MVASFEQALECCKDTNSLTAARRLRFSHARDTRRQRTLSLWANSDRMNADLTNWPPVAGLANWTARIESGRGGLNVDRTIATQQPSLTRPLGKEFQSRCILLETFRGPV